MSDDTYARVIAELRALAPGSVVLDGEGDAWQLLSMGWSCTVSGLNTEKMDASAVASLTPITVIHRAPEPSGVSGE